MPVLTVSGEVKTRININKSNKKGRSKNKFKPRKRERFIYILELENNKYYVGQSVNVENRVNQHKKGKDATWTKLHRFVSIVDVIPLGKITSKNAMIFENDKTLECAIRYGAANVRGGDFCEANPYRLIKLANG